MKPAKLFYFFVVILMFSACQSEESENSCIISQKKAGSFPLFTASSTSTLCIHPEEFKGVRIALENLKTDLEKVSGQDFPGISEDPGSKDRVIIAGTLGKSPWIDELAEKGLIPRDQLEGELEKFIMIPVSDPFPGVSSALVIAGSDRRGTIYGIYDLSQEIGVSPWYYWADVPVLQKEKLFVTKGIHTAGEPGVRYRGIFINDEAPALSGWVHENFGSFNHEFYEHVFELILRLKGNYLWPAMWGRAFYDDDSLNAIIANEYGIVIGTSHHEPLMRAHDEWRRYGEGPWNYEENPHVLQEFWRKGIERMGNNESIVTVGMRGDGDEPMTEGTAIALLEKIVKDQREIITDVTGKDISSIPQSWALYKEVQDYYDKGMRVPEDITLLLCDDNWGNIRKLPREKERDRKGGYGIYYHFDYVGGPRNYKWLNTTQIERTWEQMHLAYEYGVDRIWIVNVGDIKPMELPINFFLDYAWNPEQITAEDLPGYYIKWAARQFGPEYSKEIAAILSLYTKYNSRRKPELLSPYTYSLVNCREAENVVNDYNRILNEALKVYEKLEESYRDAFYQLVLYPVEACANLNEMYVEAAKNQLYAKQGRAGTNKAALKVDEHFQKDKNLTESYHSIKNGKWNHMMSQTHIGYTYWQEPPENKIPDTIMITVPEEGIPGIMPEGNVFDSAANYWILPEFDLYNQQEYRIGIFNRGKSTRGYEILCNAEWLKISGEKDSVQMDETISLSVLWDKMKTGKDTTILTFKSEGVEEKVLVTADNIPYLDGIPGKIFLESRGSISMEAADYGKSVTAGETEWITIPNLGRTGSAVCAFPVNNGSVEPGDTSPHLEYPVYFKDTGRVVISLYFSPTLNFHNSPGLKAAVSIDNGNPQLINIHESNSPWIWNMWVAENIIKTNTEMNIESDGKHILKYWLVDPGLVLQKIVIQRAGAPRSYLGPPPSFMQIEP